MKILHKHRTKRKCLRARVSLILFVFISIQTLCIHSNHSFAQGFLSGVYSSSLVRKGKQLKAEGDYAAAITKFSKSIKTEPNNLEADYQLGLILEEVLHYYDDAISLYKNVIALSKVLKPPESSEELKKINTLVSDAKKSIDRAIKKKFDSMEVPKVPIYIKAKLNKKICKSPSVESNIIYKTTANITNEFRLQDFNNNWYQINLPSVGLGWIRGKDVSKVILKKEVSIELSIQEKIANYKKFIRENPNSGFAWDAQRKIESLSYGLAEKENTIDSYSRFLDKFPDSRFVSDVKQRIDSLSHETAKEEDAAESYSSHLDKSPDGKYTGDASSETGESEPQKGNIPGSIDGLKDWIVNNPESPFLEKASDWSDELTFAQAKFNNDIPSFEKYIVEYPQGKFVAEAKQLIKKIKNKQEDAKVAEDADREDYIKELLDDEYLVDAKRIIDEEERGFDDLLKSEDIDALVKYLDSERDEERVGLVEEKIEELFFKKAKDAKNAIDAIAFYEEYLLKYPDGLYALEAKAKVEQLSYFVAISEDTIEAYQVFINKFPKSEYSNEANNKVINLAFNMAQVDNTREAYEQFLNKYPDSEYSLEANDKIEELAFSNAKESGALGALKAFVNTYPNSPYAQEANSMIEYLDFKDIMEKDNIGKIEEFVRKYPDSKYVEEAKYKIDQLNYEHYRGKDTVSAFEEFIKKYPESNFVEETKLRIDRLNYDYYKKKDNLKAYKKFIAKFPDNIYVDEAKQVVAQLTVKRDQKDSKHEIPVGLIIIGVLGIGIVTSVVLKRKEIAKRLQVWRSKEVDKPAISITANKHPGKYFFMTTILTFITQEESFKRICAIALKSIAIAIMIASLAGWGSNWYHVVGLPVAALIGGVIFQLIFVVAIYMVVHILFIRANDITGLPEAEYTIIPIVSVFLQVIGEVCAFFTIAISFGLGILAWIAGNYSGSIISDVVPFFSGFTGNTVVGGMLIILGGTLFAFFVLVFFYLLTELVIVISATSIDARVTRRIVEKSERTETEKAEKPKTTKMTWMTRTARTGEKEVADAL